MTDQDHLDRINALTANARNTWFALLAALVFVGITLMGVKHVDFYGVDRATQLPLVSVEVPTPYFFYAAPVLIAAIYGYFHLYLIRLWDALGNAPPRLNGVRLGDAIIPWLVADAALDLRARKRADNATTPRALEGASALLNLLLAWGFGLVVLAVLWILSLPARTFWMSAIAGVAFVVCIFAGSASLKTMFTRLGKTKQPNDFDAAQRRSDYRKLAFGIVAAVGATYFATQGPTGHPAPLNLAGENIVERPAGWLTYTDARNEFRSRWCNRENLSETCHALAHRETDFEEEFERAIRGKLRDLRRPVWDKSEGNNQELDFRKARMRGSFLAGADIRKALMHHADLRRVELQGANIRRAQLDGVRMYMAQLQFSSLQMAKFSRASLVDAQMQGASLGFSSFIGSNKDSRELQGLNLSRAVNNGGMLRNIDLSEVIFDHRTDFRNAFLDKSVKMSPAFRRQMGSGASEGPCQWATQIVEDDQVFYGRWRGWLDAAPPDIAVPPWSMIAPEEFEDVAAISNRKLRMENRPHARNHQIRAIIPPDGAFIRIFQFLHLSRVDVTS